MADTVIPLRDIDRRMAEAGRIRMGVKTKKFAKAIDTFRFTSTDRDQLEQIAARYGGDVQPWHDPKASPANQFQVIVTEPRIDVVLPPDPITQHWELWAGAGCQRRCDGEWCETLQSGRDGPEPTMVACMCRANQLKECKPHTRLSVILPGVDLRGVWRLETKGENAMRELPGMVDAIQSLARGGANLVAQLSLQREEKMVKGKKSHYVKPRLELPYTPEQIVAGDAHMVALTESTAPGELPATPNVDEEIPALPAAIVVDAEVVSELELECNDCADQYGVDRRALFRAIHAHVKGDEDRIQLAIAKMKSGDIEPDGFDAQGRVVWHVRD